MTDLVIHVGPGKCGSSSIQHFFKSKPDSILQEVEFVHLKPALIAALNVELPTDTVKSEYLTLIRGKLGNCDSLIVSHEVLFKSPLAVRHIAEFSRGLVSGIRCIGFSRRQSDFIVSAYAQWFFRSVPRVSEVNDIVRELGIQCEVFTGLEKQFIASIINDFHSARQLSDDSILDWRQSYVNLEEALATVHGEVYCGLLPGEYYRGSLIEDFCSMAGLTLSKKEQVETPRNTGYDPDIVEGINIAVATGIEMSGPHENNSLLKQVSATSEGSIVVQESQLMRLLKNYTDTFYFTSNSQLCKNFGLDPDYYRPRETCEKSQVLDRIHTENQHRQKHSLEIIRSGQARLAKITSMLMSNISPN